jgi:Calcineurin-like phosphoesterase/S-layer homology domain
MKNIFTFVLIGILILSLLVISAQHAGAQSNILIFATIGDYGVNNEYEATVANMVSGWNPDLIVGLGDDYYAEAGGTGSEKYDLSTGKYYCSFLKDTTTTGSFCPTGQSSINRFFPALGDHDYADGGMNNANLPITYTDYFNLPGAGYTSSSNNERYYDFVSGPVHFFILNGINEPGYEPDGATSSSVQAQWLQTQLGASTSIWNVVVIPNPPYSSGIIHGSASHAQWPFAQWGADVVFSGDEHNYERILRDGIVYFVNGLGGQWPYQFGTPVEGSTFRYNTKNGAQRVIVTDTSMTFEFYSVENGDTLQDTYAITVPHNTATPTLPANSTGWLSPTGQSKVTSKAGDGNGYEVTPTNAYADDALFAVDMDSGSTDVLSCLDIGKDKHKFSDYNISIPNGASVQGIQVRLDANADSIIGTPKLCVSLSWDNGSNWSEWKSTPNLANTEETYLLGGITDTWGHVWTTTELSNNFQVRVADIASDNNRDFSLDWIPVNIVYSVASTSTPTATSTFTASPTYTPTDTLTATNTSTDTPVVPTATSTFTAFPTYTSTTIPTNPFTSTATGTSTSTNTATSTASNTPTNTPSSIAVPTDTRTYTPTVTNTSAYTASPTPSNIPTAMQTSTSTSTKTATFTNLSFSDVPIDYWAGNSIERLYKAGITGGCSFNPFKYCPETIVTRDQMAVFLERGMHGSTYNPPVVGGSTGFADVLPDYWAGAWIKQLAAEGITGGCGSSNYCPESSVTRAQMAVFLLRSKYGASYAPPAVGADTGFGDVSTTYWAGAWIKQLVAEGITAGCGSGNYCPEAPVTRAQMAVFLVRTFGLP